MGDDHLALGFLILRLALPLPMLGLYLLIRRDIRSDAGERADRRDSN